VDALKREPGKNMLLLGSGEVTRLMTRHRLIDEYQFGVVPVVLGRGRKLLDDVRVPLTMSLLESRAFPTGTVLLRYTPRP
jgi:dihydrofolate reductase